MVMTIQQIQAEAKELGTVITAEQAKAIIKSRKSAERHMATAKPASDVSFDILANLPVLSATQEAELRQQVQREAAEDARAVAAQIERRKSESVLGRAAIPKRFKQRSFDNYEASQEGQIRALKVCQAFADRFSGRPMNEGTSLTLVGGMGTGKTHLVSAIANSVIQQGYQALYTLADQMVRDIRSSWGGRGNEVAELQKFIQPDLLIIDDAGAGQSSESVTAHFFQIVNARYEQMKPTIIVSNLMFDELGEAVGERVTDRMLDSGGAVLVFDWESKRGQL